MFQKFHTSFFVYGLGLLPTLGLIHFSQAQGPHSASPSASTPATNGMEQSDDHFCAKFQASELKQSLASIYPLTSAISAPISKPLSANHDYSTTFLAGSMLDSSPQGSSVGKELVKLPFNRLRVLYSPESIILYNSRNPNDAIIVQYPSGNQTAIISRIDISQLKTTGKVRKLINTQTVSVDTFTLPPSGKSCVLSLTKTTSATQPSSVHTITNMIRENAAALVSTNSTAQGSTTKCSCGYQIENATAEKTDPISCPNSNDVCSAKPGGMPLRGQYGLIVSCGSNSKSFNMGSSVPLKLLGCEKN